jgi:hypothetical protein
MDLGEALIQRLSDDAEVAAIFEDRIFWTLRPQNSDLPALVLSRAGGPPEELDLDGETDLVESTIRGSCFAKRSLQATAGAKAFGDALRHEAEIEDVLFWEADVGRPISLGGETTPAGFIHQMVVEVTLRHSPVA